MDKVTGNIGWVIRFDSGKFVARNNGKWSRTDSIDKAFYFDTSDDAIRTGGEIVRYGEGWKVVKKVV